MLEALEVVLTISSYCISGWTYLLSPSFRRECHERWERSSWFTVLTEMAVGVTGIAISVLLAMVLFRWLTA